MIRKMLLMALFFVVSFLVFSCGKDPVSTSKGCANQGSAAISIKVGEVGTLAKKTNINLSKLYVVLSAVGETSIYDTFSLSGGGSATIVKTYDSLTSLKTWTLSAKSLDDEDSVVHQGSTDFLVKPNKTEKVNLTLLSKYSMLKANFFPIRDSVTRCELLVADVKVDEASFAKQARVGDTIRLAYDYLAVGVTQKITMNAYGKMWGVDTLLYSNDTLITPIAGVDMSAKIGLHWVGKIKAPSGQASMTVALRLGGKIVINGELGLPNNVLIARYNQIIRMSPDGTSQKVLYTSSEGTIYSADFSPNMSLIAFSVTISGEVGRGREITGGGRGSVTDLYLMNSDGSGLIKLVPATYEQTQVYYPFFLDNSTVRFLGGVGSYGAQIFEIKIDGTGLRQVSNMLWQDMFVISGSAMYITSGIYDAHTSEIYKTDTGFTFTSQLTNGDNMGFTVWDVSPDGSKLLISRNASYRSPPDNLYLINSSDGSGEVQLTSFDGSSLYCGQAKFSPDGTKIMFSASDGINNDIWLMNSDGSNPIKIMDSTMPYLIVCDWK
jgi:hypothetical protein